MEDKENLICEKQTGGPTDLSGVLAANVLCIKGIFCSCNALENKGADHYDCMAKSHTWLLSLLFNCPYSCGHFRGPSLLRILPF